MQVFTLTKVSPMGQPDDFGQKYWCETSDSDFPLMFSTKKDIKVGITVAAEKSEERKSAKGNSYLWLTKVVLIDNSGSQGHVEDAEPTLAPSPATQAPQNPEVAVDLITKEQGDEIIRLLKVIAMEDGQGEEPKNNDAKGDKEMPEGWLEDEK